MFNKILTVCVGNVCRSPTAERLLQSLLPNKTVESAGVAALVDHKANSQAASTAENHGLSLDNHKARQLTNVLCYEYDLILVMENDHLEAVYNIAPEARGKVMLLGRWLDNLGIEDPYKRSDDMYEHVYQLIDKACHSWMDKL